MKKLAILLFAALCSTACLAADEGRKVDFTVVLNDPDGDPLLECADMNDRECKVKRPMTLGSAAMRCLTMQESGLSPEDSLKRGQLALSVYKSAGASLTEEEVVLIKKQISKGLGPLVTVRAFPLLFSK